MDGDGQAPEDLQVNLNWPGDDQPDAESGLRRRQDQGKPPPPETGAPTWELDAAPEDLAPSLRVRRSASPPAEQATPELPDGPGVEQGAGSTRDLDPSIARRLDRLAASQAATSKRIDSLTDSTVTLRGFVNERMADVGDAVARSQTQITGDLGEAASDAQAQTARQIAEAFDLLQAQSARSSVEDQRRQEEATAAMQEGLAANKETVRRIERLSSAVSAELATIGQRLTDEVEAVCTQNRSELSGLGEQLSAQVDATAETTRADLAAISRRLSTEVETAVASTVVESRQKAEAVTADIAGLGESVADALAQVADRLERLAMTNSGQRDTAEAVTEALDDVAVRLDDLDSTGRARHDRIVAAVGDLRSKGSNVVPVDLGTLASRFERIDTFLVALMDANEDSTDNEEKVTAALKRLEGLEATIAEQVSDAATGAVRTLTDAAERAAAQIKAAAPPMVDRSSLAAMTRIEGRMAELTRQREEHEHAAKGRLDNLEETVGRLASAQAEDFERILDTVENAPPASVSLAASDAQRLARIEDQLRTLSRSPPVGAADGDGTAGEQMAALGNQIEALRRRMAVRARPQAPVLDANAIETIAEAVAARLTGPGRSAPAKVPTKRAGATPRKATSQRPGTESSAGPASPAR
ncbi:MAG: hypothetical protein M3256_07095 [Actinomycetota bacterium]|nr:hypothetical protein [Actinomycetota bacterium]